MKTDNGKIVVTISGNLNAERPNDRYFATADFPTDCGRYSLITFGL